MNVHPEFLAKRRKPRFKLPAGATDAHCHVFVPASCHGTDNAAMLDCIASDPKRYRGVAIVDDGFTDADYDRLDAGGVRGVRFNFVKHLGGAPDMAVFN